MAKSTERVKEKRCRKGVARFLSLIKFRDDNLKATRMVFAKLDEIRRKETAANKKLVIKCGGKTVLKDLETKYSRKADSPDNPLSMTIFNGVDPASYDPCVEDTANKDSRNSMCLYNDSTISDGGVDLNDYFRSISGSNPEFLFEKRLTKTDVTKSQGRLLIPVKQVRNLGFLTKDERNLLMTNKEGLKVTVLDSQKRKWKLNLGIWTMSCNENYVLKSGWNQVVDANRLKENMMVQVWSFRVDQQICFAVVRVRRL